MAKTEFLQIRMTPESNQHLIRVAEADQRGKSAWGRRAILQALELWDAEPPSGPPPSVGVLGRYARAYAQELGVAEGRIRAWIACMILAGVLERSASTPDGYRFTVKGGVALELRLRTRARATKDIDLVLHDAFRRHDGSRPSATFALPDAIASCSYEPGSTSALNPRYRRIP